MEAGLLLKSNFFFALKKSVTELCLSCELTCSPLPGVPSFFDSLDPLISPFFPSSPTSLFLVEEGGVRRGEEEEEEKEREGVLQFSS